jgi:outer membrane protein assembly factor BamA
LKLRTRLIIILFLVISILSPFANSLHAKEQATEKKDNNSIEARQKWVVVPVAAYGSETGVILGSSLFYFPPTSANAIRNSSLDIILFGTTKGQYFITLVPDLYIDNGRYRLIPKLFWSFWKSSYYGIGNDLPDEPENYDSNNIGFKLSLDRLFPSGFTLGPVFNIRWNNIEPEQGGKMEADAPEGIGRGFYSGAGIAAGYDSRDNTNAPHAGNLIRYEYVHYIMELGSDLDFDVHQFDLSHYFPTSERTTFAVAGQVRISRGHIPFRLLSRPDGIRLLRGIESRRYLDRDLFALQSEFRYPIKGKFSGTVFAEVAQVASDINDINFDNFKSSIGGGLRYTLNPEQRLNFRIDLAWVDDKIGFIANVREAF